MISTRKPPSLTQARRHAVAEVSKLRGQAEDLMDYLDLLEARAQNKGRREYTVEEVRQKLGLPRR